MQLFNKLAKNVGVIKKYLPFIKDGFCDLSLGVKYIWREEFVCEYLELNETLILKEKTREYQNAFYFPIGKDVKSALDFIDDFTNENGITLTFCCLTKEQADFLEKRYKNVEIFYNRNWSDYFYDAQSFAFYVGKKYSGQRNHVNKFKSLYPNFIYKRIEKEDIPKIKSFILEYESGKTIDFWIEKEEQKQLLEYLHKLNELGQVGACIYVEDKIVGITIGEVVNETLIVHVEKALKDYKGVYPTLAQAFSKDVLESFSIKLINREEDCGDMGLRTSKAQYHPIDIKHKYFLTIKN